MRYEKKFAAASLRSPFGERILTYLTPGSPEGFRNASNEALVFLISSIDVMIFNGFDGA